MVDILKEIHENKITSDEGYDIIDETVDKFHDDKLTTTIEEELNLNKYEWAAYCYTASLETIVRWRYKGWPIACEHCGKPINYQKYYWIVREDKLKCLHCE